MPFETIKRQVQRKKNELSAIDTAFNNTKEATYDRKQIIQS